MAWWTDLFIHRVLFGIPLMCQSNGFRGQVNGALAEHWITCDKVEDNGIGALVRIHGPGYVSHHSARRGVLGDSQLLIRQAATLKRPKKGNE